MAASAIEGLYYVVVVELDWEDGIGFSEKRESAIKCEGLCAGYRYLLWCDSECGSPTELLAMKDLFT